MADKVENLVLEHLRHIRRAVDEMALDVGDLKLRMSTVESNIANIQVQLAGHSSRFDRMDERLSRIERRLELHEPA